MQIVENLKIKEKLYKKKLQNGLTIMVFPRKNIQKKYIIWGVNYGSNNNIFKVAGDDNLVKVPNGVAHFLEHKLFEQEKGKNSLDTLTDLGVNANAFTTNTHTAYLYECTDNFFLALDEFMNYVQNPYFTDKNVEKEKGIIVQEIKMYDDYPDWKVYLNALECMYYKNPIKIDITGTVDSIEKIDKEILYKCYNAFYNFNNMAIVVAGDFEPDEIIKEIEKRLIKKNERVEVERIYEEEPEGIVNVKVEQKMDVSIPIYTIGIKDKATSNKEIVKKHIAIQIILNVIIGESSKLYKNLYECGNSFFCPYSEYDFDENYAHVLITGQSKDPDELFKMFKEEIKVNKEKGINKEDFERIRKMLYGDYVKEYNNISDICRNFLSDYFKGINSFDYLDEIETINLEYVNKILEEVFKNENMILSIIKK